MIVEWAHRIKDHLEVSRSMFPTDPKAKKILMGRSEKMEKKILMAVRPGKKMEKQTIVIQVSSVISRTCQL